MTILQKIKEEHTSARKNQDKFRLKILGTLLAEVQSIGKNAGQRETTDQEAVQRVQKFKKNLEESFKHYTKYSMDDFFDACLDKEMFTPEAIVKTGEMFKERDIYAEFLPKQLTRVEMVYNMGLFLGQQNEAQMRDVMQHFSKNFPGQYNGKELSSLVKEML